MLWGIKISVSYTHLDVYKRQGYPTIASLRGADPEELYRRDCEMQGVRIDRCQLYVYRCAVYYASTPHPEPEKLKWWYWKDKELALIPEETKK